MCSGDVSRPYLSFAHGRRGGYIPVGLALTSKGRLPYKPRDLEQAGDPEKWRFSGAAATIRQIRQNQ
jgi:hypothetical protein